MAERPPTVERPEDSSPGVERRLDEAKGSRLTGARDGLLDAWDRVADAWDAVGARLLIVAVAIGLLVAVVFWPEIARRAPALPSWTASPTVAPATPAPTPPAPTASAPTTTPASATAAVAAPSAVPAATPSPVAPTPDPATATAARPTPTVDPAVGTGRDPLPPGVDLTDGPFIKRLGETRPGTVYADDGQLGSQLAKRFLEAMEVEGVDVENGDDSRVREYFTGEALSMQLRRIQRARQSTAPLQQRIVTEHRVMRTILAGQGDDDQAYVVADAATERVQQIKPWQRGSGQPVEVLKETDQVRVCYSWQIRQVDGKWKLDQQNRSIGSGYCPDGWN